MTVFPTPNLFADFTQSSFPPYIYNGAIFRDANSWLSAISATFSRSSVAYFTNSSGLLQQAANNVLRFDYDPVTLAAKGILLEATSTNLLSQSNTFSNATWTAQHTNNTPLAQNVAGPDGVSNSAWTMTANAITGVADLFQTSLTLGNGNTFTASVYFKPGTNRFCFMSIFDDVGGGGHFAASFDLVSGTVAGQLSATGSCSNTSTSIVNGPNGFKRVTMTGVAGSATGGLVFGFANGASGNTFGPNGEPTGNYVGTETLIISDAQVEGLSFASSYFPTTSSSGIRAADSLTATPISGWYFSVNGTLFRSSDVMNVGVASPNALGIADAGIQNFIYLRQSSSNSLAVVSSGNVVQFNPLTSDGGQSGDVANTSSKAALSAQAGNFIYVKNGAGADSGSSGIMPVAPTQLDFGGVLTGNPIFGHIAMMAYWPIPFTVAQLQALTSGTIAFDFGTTLTRAGKYFSRKDYVKWLAKIVAENKANQRQQDELIAAVEAERNLTDIERADRDYNNAEEEYGQSEAALFNNLTSTNHIKFSEAKERRERARKERDHHYYMEVVKKAWADHDAKRR